MELELWLAVYSGDVEEVKEILRMNPKPKVNALSDHGSTALIEACDFDWDAIVAILLAHPDIDVNHKDSLGITPLARACFKGSTSSVRLLLKDPRVKVNEPNGGGYTPLWLAASKGHLGVIKWWFASERVVDLGEPGANSDVIKWAKAMGRTEVVALLENFRENPEKARYTARAEFGLIDDLAARCSPCWSLSRAGCCKSGARPRHLLPGSSPGYFPLLAPGDCLRPVHRRGSCLPIDSFKLLPGCRLNSRWC